MRLPGEKEEKDVMEEEVATAGDASEIERLLESRK